jgi:tRNA pseudouridine55 synthase
MTCGKGGYVRAIARDVGAALGCLGHVTGLRRLRSGPFGLEGAVGWAEIEAGGVALAARLLPVEAALAGVPELACPPSAAQRLRNGNPVPLAASLPEGATAWASAGGVPLAIGTWRGGELHPSRVLVLA